VTGTLALALAHPWLALIVVLSASLIGALLVWWVWRMLWRGMRRLVAPLREPGPPVSPQSPSP